MVNSGKVIFCTLLVVTLLSCPSGTVDILSQPVEEASVEVGPEGQLSSSGVIVLRIEWNNPFNPEASDPLDDHTEIHYEVKGEGATIRIYSINGELVRSDLVEDKTKTEDTIEWDGRNDKGKVVGSGVYLVNLKIGKSSKTVKVVILK
ncbi:T9SS type A sorting domain-containing protein [bacterium]|nr:T9SS type A sorting domain-containing protein [bacterium]NIN92105.1 T9SS type A sorting domain-containing protein [bacterium]NIO18311.1 T9SS type A sorting domain-containing protein [bacterium]NIO73276.1 T9SS type A sorting domain-containing protein [bacterium]